jgi:hypothetical protein
MGDHSAMKIGWIFLLVPLVAGCDRRLKTPAKAYQDWGDRLTVATGIPFSGLDGPCVDKIEEQDGAYIYHMRPTSKCYRMTEPKRWHGIWTNEFEGSRFCEGAKSDCPYVGRDRRTQPQVWLGSEHSWSQKHKALASQGTLFEIEFVGRRTLYEGSYGHMGMSDHEIVVDRIISMRKIR